MRLDLLTTPWPEGYHLARPCPICGEPWRPWALSRLPCHARCLFDEAEQRTICASSESMVSMVSMAARYSVPISAIRATLRYGRARRRAQQ